MNDLPHAVRIREVGPRDGFQNEPEVIATADKVRLIGLLGAAGLERIEVTSLVRPDVIPQLADAEQVLEAIDAAGAYSPAALDAPQPGADGEGERTLGDTLGGHDIRYEMVELGQSVGPAFRALPEREQLILKLRFIDDLTQSEIAEKIGVSQMHVSRLLRRSVSQLNDAGRD